MKLNRRHLARKRKQRQSRNEGIMRLASKHSLIIRNVVKNGKPYKFYIVKIGVVRKENKHPDALFPYFAIDNFMIYFEGRRGLLVLSCLNVFENYTHAADTCELLADLMSEFKANSIKDLKYKINADNLNKLTLKQSSFVARIPSELYYKAVAGLMHK